MLCLPFRRKARKEDPPKPGDCGVFPDGPRQPDPEEFSMFCRHRRPGKGWGLRGARPWSQDGARHSRGNGESWRDTGMPGGAAGCARADGREPGTGRSAGVKVGSSPGPSGMQRLGKDIRDEPRVPCSARNGNAPRCAEVDGKAPEKSLEKLEAGRSAGGGKTPQEKPRENAPSGTQHLGEEVRGEPGVPRGAQNGNVPREGTDRPQPPPRAVQPESSGSARRPGSSTDRGTDTAATPNGHGRDPEPPSGAEPRERLRERLRRLGEDAESWEGKSTAELAAQLAQRILRTPTQEYPTEPGAWSGRREPAAAAGRDLELAVPVGSFVGVLELCGNAESSEEEEQEEVEEEEQEEEEEEAALDLDSDEERDFPPVHIYHVRVSMPLADEFPEVWARSRLDCGRLAEEERLDGAPVPFQPQPRLPQHVENRMARLLREYLERGIVEVGSSKSNNPLILIPKSNGRGWRLTLKCQKLNEATPVGPQERLERADILASINPRSRFFSVLDLSNACLAVPLAPGCRPRFAFTFRDRQFWFARLPPTFHGAGSIVHRRVAALLARLERGVALGVFQYYDDILVTGRSWRQAERRTRKVLELIQQSGFKVNPEKAQLMRREVKFLGVAVGRAGRRIPAEKLEEIRRDCGAAGPRDARALRSILGKLGSWSGFVPDYRELALPLQRLAAPGNREWEWGREQRRQLRRLVEALEAAPPLPFPAKCRPFVLRLSRCPRSVGAALLQERRGLLVPVGHFSRSPGGRSLSGPELRLLAAAWAVQAFRASTGPAPIVIQDSPGNYLVRGDALDPYCSWFPVPSSQPPEPWRLLLTSGRPEGPRSQRISIPAAPELRQLPAGVPKADVWFLAVAPQGRSVGFAATNREDRWLLGATWGGSEEDAELAALAELLEQDRVPSPLYLYSRRPSLAARLERRERERGWNSGGEDAWPRVLRWLRAFPNLLRVGEPGRAGEEEEEEEERVWMERASARAWAAAGAVGKGCRSWEVSEGGWKSWEPSRYERQEIVARCHGWHEDEEVTLARVRAVQPWEGDRQDVARWVRRCPVCRHHDPDPDPNPDPGPQREEGPWSRLWIGLSRELPESTEGFRALLVVRDELSGWLDAFPLLQRAAPDVTGILHREVFGRLGKVGSVLLEPGMPAWLWDSLRRPPLRPFWARLEPSEPRGAAESLCRVARAAGKGWAGMLPLLLAGIRAGCLDRARLGPLLCIPDFPLELLRECPAEGQEGEAGNGSGSGNGNGNGNGNGSGNELSRLRGMQMLQGYSQGVGAVLNRDLQRLGLG